MEGESTPSPGHDDHHEQIQESLTPEAASWNPALRPENSFRHGHVSKASISSVDDFFDRYPGPTPEKRRPQPTIINESHESEEEPEEEEAAGVRQQEDIDEEMVQPQTLERPTTPRITEDLTDREDDGNAPPEAALIHEQQAGDLALETANDYEHQGDDTELDRAIDEAPNAPLLMDPEQPPVVEETSYISGDSPGPQDVPVLDRSQPSLDRSFTTNFTEIPAAEHHDVDAQAEDTLGSQTVDDWPTETDDHTFGELLSGNAGSSGVVGEGVQEAELDPPFVGNLAQAVSQAPVQRSETDLAAAWQAALGDDDLLETADDLDPSAFFGDDDDGFLEDELSPLPSASSQSQAKSTLNSNPYAPAPQPTPAFLGQSHGRTVSTPQTGLTDMYNHSNDQGAGTRPGLTSAQSFVDKAKGGYQSPYDLPMDVIKQPRQRPRQAPAPTSTPNGPIPPPRTSSFSSQHETTTSRPPTAGGLSNSATSAQSVLTGSKPESANRTPSSDSGFFADLPVASRVKPRTSGAYTPQPQSPFPGAQPPPIHQARPTMPSAPPSQTYTPSPRLAPEAPAAPSVYGGLRQPDRLPLLPDQPSLQQPSLQPPTAPPQNQRYSPSRSASSSQPRFSPAPPVQAPPAASRYSPVSHAQPTQPKRQPSATAVAAPGILSSHPFAPRTSSPLAFSSEKQQAPYTPDGQRHNSFQAASPPKANGIRTHFISPPNGFATPSRPHTQSPPTVMKAAKTASMALDRSISAAPSHPLSQKVVLPHRRGLSRDLTFQPPMDERAQDPLERWKGHAIFSWGASGAVVSSLPQQTPFYAAGHAIPTVRCTPGSITLQDAKSWMPLDDSTVKFPGPLAARAKAKKKDVLSWMSSKIEEMTKQVEQTRMDFELDNDLKHRAEEKLLLWRLMKIFVDHNGVLEGDEKINEEIRAILLPDLAQVDASSPTSAISAAPQGDQIDRATILEIRQALLAGQRERAVFLAEDKKMWGHAMLIASTLGPDIWKRTVQAFVRSQVKPVGSDARALAAVYQVFAGNADECADELVPPSARHGRQFVSMTGTVTGDPLAGLDQWRETLGLITGNRTPNDTQSLISLGKLLSDYGRPEAAHSCFLFARQSAKHSGADDQETHFVLLGSDHRGSDHRGSDPSFGKDLDSIILTEIYEWATSLSAPSVAVHYLPHLQSYKLIHAQQLAGHGLKSQAQAYCDHITSAYTSSTKPSQYYHPAFTQSVTDLSAYLSQSPQAGAGLLSKTAMNKVSSGAASWFTKFVSGDDDSAADGSNASGNEDQNGPFGRLEGDSPQLSRQGSLAEIYNPMAGSPPVLGQIAMGSSPQKYSPAMSGSRYALGAGAGANRYNPGGITNQAAELRRPGTGSSRSYAPTSSLSAAFGRPEADRAVSDPAFGNVHGGRSGPGSNVSSLYGSYDPKPAFAESAPSFGYQPTSAPRPTSSSTASSLYANGLNIVNATADVAPHAESSAYTPPINGIGSPHGGYEAPSASYEPPSTSYEPPASYEPADDDDDDDVTPAATGFEPTSSGYEPPDAGYEPPSYQPYEPEASEEADDDVPRKSRRGMMADDDENDDLAKRSAEMQKSQKAAADKQADDAFRKAAEADAARDAAKSDKRNSGWFGGWFKKDGSAAPQQGPIRAKLGEENSFVYDETLKKWVNKKAGAEEVAPVAATPPPPRGPASRVSSGGTPAPPMGPPSGPPSRVASGAGGPPGRMLPGSGPPSRVGTPAMSGAGTLVVNGGEGAPPVIAPPSRPATGMSNASSLDDLLGGPPGPGRKTAGGAKAKKKGGRYVDVMGAK